MSPRKQRSIATKRSGASRRAANDSGEIGRSVDLLWGTGLQSVRGPKPSLTLERVAEAAIEIADNEGLAAVSMQRVAASFRLSTMSMYRYVPSKADLVNLMMDAAIGAPLEFAPNGNWKENLRRWAAEISVCIHRHPWTLETLNYLRPMGPNELGWLETGVKALEGTRLYGPEKLHTVSVVMGHVRSTAQYSIQLPPEQRGVSNEQWMRMIYGLSTRSPARFASLIAAFASAGPSDPSTLFEFGLEVLLDGVGALIDKRAGKSSKPRRAQK